MMQQPHSAQIHRLAPASAGREVQDGIRRIEGSIDEMLAENAALLAKTLRAGQLAGLAPAFAHKALQRQLSMLDAGMKLRALAFTAHQDMRVALKRIDRDVVGWGDMGDSPSIQPVPDDGAAVQG